VIPKLTAEDVPAEARELKDELAGMLPFAPIASLLIELDQRTSCWRMRPVLVSMRSSCSTVKGNALRRFAERGRQATDSVHVEVPQTDASQGGVLFTVGHALRPWRLRL
jgi:hypothetical protein